MTSLNHELFLYIRYHVHSAKKLNEESQGIKTPEAKKQIFILFYFFLKKKKL